MVAELLSLCCRMDAAQPLEATPASHRKASSQAPGLFASAEPAGEGPSLVCWTGLCDVTLVLKALPGSREGVTGWDTGAGLSSSLAGVQTQGSSGPVCLCSLASARPCSFCAPPEWASLCCTCPGLRFSGCLSSFVVGSRNLFISDFVF